MITTMITTMTMITSTITTRSLRLPNLLSFFRQRHLTPALVGIISFLGTAPVLAQNAQDQLAEIVVSGQSENDLRLKKEEINRIESLKVRELERKNAVTFAQLIDQERGVDTQTACSFCGAKRVTINGLKGEHTTILIDGLPLHSTVSSFYGVEAIPLGGLDSIDIYRGAGAALTAPESIGGAMNLLTREILSSGAEFHIAGADSGQTNLSAVATHRISDKTGVLLGVQVGQIRPLDLDHNGVTEIPRQNTQTAMLKLTHQLNDAHEVSFRLSHADLKTIGGTDQILWLDEAVPVLVDSDSFEGRDVRRAFLGETSLITDNVRLQRTEAALQSRSQLNSESSLKLSLGAAWQNQNSIYSHGYDYDNKDSLWVAQAEYQRTAGENHLLTFGIDTKQQRMDSSSRVLYVDKGLPEDDLRFSSSGAFIQDSWFLNERNELSLVLRFDHLKTQWLDLDRSLERSVLAPRIFYKHLHNDVLTSRLAYGVGYRAPLTLFESMHGTDHYGFLIEIDELEVAHSLVYSLAGQREDDFFEVGAHVTRLENLAYGVDRVLQADPTVFRNSEESYLLSTFDLSYGRRLTPAWTLEGLLELFQYPSGYKEKLPVAAIEQRLSLTSTYERGPWSLIQRLSLIGERNLSAYGYDSHYNVAFTDNDPLSGTFGETFVDEQKFQTAPTYFTLDLLFERRLGANLFLGFSVLNVFDYTQTKAGDSPTTWDLHGTEYHLDNFHLWGPLRGREFFLSLRGIY